MSDGSIRISLEVDGKQVDVATTSLDNLDAAGRKAGDGAKETEEGVKGAGNESQKAGSKVKKFASALGLVAVGAAAFQVLRRSMDDAIARFDTMDQFPKVLEGLGASADDSEQAVTRLSDGIDGLPTKLDDITNTTQRMYTAFDDADKAADSALAVNNALLSSSASANDARRGTEQYIQALQTGNMDMQQWRTLQETMNVGLVKVAEAFGYAGSSATNNLYAALRDGEITMDQFNDKLIEVGTGTGELAGLARENSLGISTSFGNLRYAVARGITRVIESFDHLSREVTGNSIAENIDGMKDVTVAAFDVVGNAIESATPFVKGFANTVSAALPVIEALSPVLIGMASAYAMHSVINRTADALKASQAVTAAVTAVKKAYTLAIMENTTGYLTNAAAAKVSAAATRARSALIAAATAAELLLTRQITFAQAAMLAKAAAARVLGAAMRFLTGPVGWVTAGIGALVGAAVTVVSWFNRTSAEAERLQDETEELGDATDALNESVQESSDAYQNNQKDIQDTAQANSDLADKIDELANKENKSAGEKQMLSRYIEELNGSVEGLNLSYDEQADAMNMTSQELQARVDLMKAEESGIAAQERLNEIEQERNDIGMQLEEVNKLREEWNEGLRDGSVRSGEYANAIADLDEQEQELTGTLDDLKVQQAETEEQVAISTKNMTDAIEESNLNMISSYEDLSEEQQETFDRMKESYESLVETATNAFDRISTESEYSLDEMIENMEHNRQATEEWGENRAAIMEWASKEGHTGFMKWVDQLGIDHAGELAEMAKALDDSSDEQIGSLEELAKGYDDNTQTAIDAYKENMGEGFDNAVDMMVDHVDESSATMRSEMYNAGFENIGKIVPNEMMNGIDNTSDVVFTGLNRFAQDMLDPFDNTSGDFSSIGANAMSGLNTGLNNNEGSVLSTARRIAGSVAGVMRGALQTRSPSRVTMKIGEDTGEGYLLGLRSKIRDVVQASEDMARMSMPDIPVLKTSTPEMALGTNSMAFTGGGSQTINRQSTVNNSRSYAPQINNYFTRDESTPSEVARKNKQQQQRLAMETGF
ncbi:tape measure protein [Virgibacillus oceani]